jgi:acyl-CoA thioester hydrolase
MRSEFTFWITFPTRFRDMDAVSHVNSSVYFTYFENGRTEFFARSGVAALRVPGKWGIPVVSQTCHYRDQVVHPETLDVGVRCTELRDKTVHLVYEIYRAGSDKLVAEGASVSVWADLEQGKSVERPLPDNVRDAIASMGR